eukprot:scaffold12673_cov124-Isochrysis_galbana.AAC.1
MRRQRTKKRTTAGQIEGRHTAWIKRENRRGRGLLVNVRPPPDRDRKHPREKAVSVNEAPT